MQLSYHIIIEQLYYMETVNNYVYWHKITLVS